MSKNDKKISETLCTVSSPLSTENLVSPNLKNIQKLYFPTANPSKQIYELMPLNSTVANDAAYDIYNNNCIRTMSCRSSSSSSSCSSISTISVTNFTPFNELPPFNCTYDSFWVDNITAIPERLNVDKNFINNVKPNSVNLNNCKESIVLSEISKPNSDDLLLDTIQIQANINATVIDKNSSHNRSSGFNFNLI